MATTGYAAGFDTGTFEMSYAKEAAWGTLPAVPFKKIRLTGESLTSNKSRQRAAEIDGTRQAADMVTTQFGASGGVNGAMSIGTYDDFFESLFNAPFTTDIITNGATFQSLYIQKKIASGLFLRYPGAYVSSCNISAAVGGFVTVAFQLMAKSEEKSLTDASTGAATEAPNGRVINTVSMVSNILLAGTSPGKIESFSLDITNDGAAAQYAIGDSGAAGMLPGVFTVSGRMRSFFKDFTVYDRYIAETEGAFAFSLVDSTKSYLFELLNSLQMNPNIVAGGPGQAVMAEFAIEGKKDSVTGKTLRLTRDLT